MKKLFERIIAWGADKFPGLEYQALPQIGFLIKELAEALDEFIKGDINKAVGEITDIIVFAINALVLLQARHNGIIYYDIYHDNSGLAVIRRIDKEISNVINSAWFNDNNKPAFTTYKNLIDVCCYAIYGLGYSPEIALEETIKKIESREGAFNPESGKWEKTATKYEPDYSLAKLK